MRTTLFYSFKIIARALSRVDYTVHACRPTYVTVAANFSREHVFPRARARVCAKCGHRKLDARGRVPAKGGKSGKISIVRRVALSSAAKNLKFLRLPAVVCAHAVKESTFINKAAGEFYASHAEGSANLISVDT